MNDKVIGTNVGDKDNTYNFTFQSIYALFTGQLNQLFVPYQGATTDLYMGNYGYNGAYLSVSGGVGFFGTLTPNGDPGFAGASLESAGASAPPVWSNKSYGCFISKANQTTTASAVVPVLFADSFVVGANVTVEDNGSTGLSRITFADAGTYNVSFSLNGVRLSATDPAPIVFVAFLKKNGANVDYSTVSQSYPNAMIAELSGSYILDMQAGDYIEVYWTFLRVSGTDTVSLSTTAPSSPLPGFPSARISVQKIK